MTAKNYENELWGLIYDQMVSDGQAEWLADNRRFYRSLLRGVTGPVLECACGTGLLLLPLLADGLDMYGFDVSRNMLRALRRSAEAQGLTVANRLSIQDFQTFHYAARFAAITIPTNSFEMLTTQEAQIRALRNIYDHLAPDGRLLMDIHLAGPGWLMENAETVEGNWYEWTHPETGLPIRQRIIGRIDLDNQRTLDHCYIEYQDRREDFPMHGRWIYKEEFGLLLRLAGFVDWEVYGDPDGAPLRLGLDMATSYWVAAKPAG